MTTLVEFKEANPELVAQLEQIAGGVDLEYLVTNFAALQEAAATKTAKSIARRLIVQKQVDSDDKAAKVLRKTVLKRVRTQEQYTKRYKAIVDDVSKLLDKHAGFAASVWKETEFGIQAGTIKPSKGKDEDEG